MPDALLSLLRRLGRVAEGGEAANGASSEMVKEALPVATRGARRSSK